jgi:hypothetical protein
MDLQDFTINPVAKSRKIRAMLIRPFKPASKAHACGAVPMTGHPGGAHEAVRTGTACLQNDPPVGNIKNFVGGQPRTSGRQVVEMEALRRAMVFGVNLKDGRRGLRKTDKTAGARKMPWIVSKSSEKKGCRRLP